MAVRQGIETGLQDQRQVASLKVLVIALVDSFPFRISMVIIAICYPHPLSLLKLNLFHLEMSVDVSCYPIRNYLHSRDLPSPILPQHPVAHLLSLQMR